jgi:hypothetical protein
MVAAAYARNVDLDRQERPEAVDAAGRPLVPQRVPETRPTPLQDWFIYLSVIVLICGTVAISAFEFGAPIYDVWVRLPVVIGGFILALVTADAIVRVWRSAWAWIPVDRNRGLFRFVWVAALIAIFLAAAVVTAGFLLMAMAA